MNTTESPSQLYKAWKNGEESDAHMALAALSLLADAGNKQAQQIVDRIDRENSVSKRKPRVSVVEHQQTP